MADQELERIYTIPLRKVKAGSQNKMTNRAVREVKSFLTRHMKSSDIWIDDAVNQAIWAHGMYTIPSKLRVRAVKFGDGVVEVSLPEEEASASIRAKLKEERESKAPILPTPAAEEGEGEGPAPAGEIEAEPEVAGGEDEPKEPKAEAAPKPEPAAKPEPKTKAEAQPPPGAKKGHKPPA